MNFPQYISFTVTNSCNLRCRMCGQWSSEGYIYNQVKSSASLLKLADWKRLVDEISSYSVKSVLLRGGEPFLFPGIIDLIEYINSKGIFVSVDTNGTVLKKYAADLVRIGNMHLTFSVDGPEEIHDAVRGKKGCYQEIKANIYLLNELEKTSGHKLSKSICFTISKYSYKGLGQMPAVARDMSISSLSIVPYYYVPRKTGLAYQEELARHFNCAAFSWQGFHHEESGIDFDLFRDEYRKYLADLGEIYNFPYMDFKEEEYRVWFNDPLAVVGAPDCHNVEKLIDIQPDGTANFCVDFPDYVFGRVQDASICEIWNSPAAEKFRSYRRNTPLAVCYRCGARYISEIK